MAILHIEDEELLLDFVLLQHGAEVLFSLDEASSRYDIQTIKGQLLADPQTLVAGKVAQSFVQALKIVTIIHVPEDFYALVLVGESDDFSSTKVGDDILIGRKLAFGPLFLLFFSTKSLSTCCCFCCLSLYFTPAEHFQVDLALEELAVDLSVDALELSHILSLRAIGLVGGQYTLQKQLLDRHYLFQRHVADLHPDSQNGELLEDPEVEPLFLFSTSVLGYDLVNLLRMLALLFALKEGRE